AKTSPCSPAPPNAATENGSRTIEQGASPRRLHQLTIEHPLPPHPDPLPRGEGTRKVACRQFLQSPLCRRLLFVRISKRSNAKRCPRYPRTANDSPSPQGRGPG